MGRLLQDGEVGLIYNKNGKNYVCGLHPDEHQALNLVATGFKTITISEKLQVDLKSNMLDILKDIEPEMWVRLKFLQINEKVDIKKHFGKRVIVLEHGHDGSGWDIRTLSGFDTNCNELYYKLSRESGHSGIEGKRALYELLFEEYVDQYIDVIKQSSITDRIYLYEKMEVLNQLKG
jgi:hypothetical protein